MPHIYIVTRPTLLWGSSGDSNVQTHAKDPRIVTTRPRQIPSRFLRPFRRNSCHIAIFRIFYTTNTESVFQILPRRCVARTTFTVVQRAPHVTLQQGNVTVVRAASVWHGLPRQQPRQWERKRQAPSCVLTGKEHVQRAAPVVYWLLDNMAAVRCLR